VFVLDTSSSMGTTAGGSDANAAPSKFDRVRAELVKTLRDLDRRTRFDLVFFSSGVSRWQKQLVPATEENKERAIRFLATRSVSGATDLYGALAEALSIREPGEASPECGLAVDEIVLLSDGWPSTGRYVEANSVVELISRSNRYARTVLHTISVRDPGLLESDRMPVLPFMDVLAARNGGEHREITLD
jgi:uncharacterized protein with von Willebrand factor type A (vWA) domain